jgi:hypothetical protein
MDFWFAPPIAFLIYLGLCGILAGIGRYVSQDANVHTNTSLYASGESSAGEQEEALVVPGYRPFFQVALFFAVLHLGVLVLASSSGSPMSLVYVLGLVVMLIALILG